MMIKYTKLALAAAASLVALSPAQADSLNEAITADLPSLMEIYRDLHANPELSGEEVRTAAKLAAEARRLGFTVTEKVGGTGVVASTGALAAAGGENPPARRPSDHGAAVFASGDTASPGRESTRESASPAETGGPATPR